MISEDQRKKYEEQYGEFTHKLEEKKTEFQKEHPDKQVQQEKVRFQIHRIDSWYLFTSMLSIIETLTTFEPLIYV